MWGFGGRYYWGRNEIENVEGIVVVFAWLSSQDIHLNKYVHLYSSFSWNSLVCHSKFLNLFSPDKGASSLALQLVNVLLQELKRRPCPVVFASFSGGPKACMYKVLEIIHGKSQEQPYLDDYQLVRDCIAGFKFDSSPVDFTSDLGTKFVLHPTILKMSRPPLFVSWIANGISSSLDAMFLSKFEADRAEYWQTLYSSSSMGAPYLIFCSENDDLAPCQIICNFAQRLRGLGADVKLVKWNSSSHVGHYRNYPAEYKAAVSELLAKAAFIYSKKIQQLEGEKMGSDGTHDDISGPFSHLRKVAASSSQSSHRVALDSNNYYLVPSSEGYHEVRDLGSVPDDCREPYISISSQQKINPHGILGQLLFDVCVPKNVEDWDIRRLPSSGRQPYTSARRHSPFNSIKCLRRSRL